MALIKFFRKGEKFTDVFRSMTSNLTEACRLLEEFTANPTDDGTVTSRIKEHERKGDQLVKDVIQKLDITFITPFDREDIHELAGVIDDVLDLVHRASSRITMYRIRREVPGSSALARLLTEQSHALEAAVTHLNDQKKEEVLRHCERVNELEHKADTIYAETVRSIFDNVTDPIELIKLVWIRDSESCSLFRRRCTAWGTGPMTRKRPWESSPAFCSQPATCRDLTSRFGWC
jgi:uncharacterized protein Yka (UPF0111/DUF47 family)